MRNTYLKVLFLLIFESILNASAQTWSSNPALNTYTTVGSGSTITCTFGDVSRSIIIARVINLNSSTVTIQFSRSGTFGASGTAYVVPSECDATGVLTSTTYTSGSSGATFSSFNHGVTVGNPKTFYVRITPNSGSLRYISLPITITAECTVPSGLSSSNISHAGFTASWNSMPGATSYNINYTLSANSYPGFTTSTSSNNIYISNNIAGCKDYKFQVQAVYPTCTSNFSGSAFATTGTYPTPTNVSANNITSTNATINWNTVSGGSPAYKVESCDGTIDYGESNVNFRVLNGLTPGTTYSIRVRTQNQGGAGTCVSSPSSCVTFTTLLTVPPSPTNLTAILSGTRDAVLNWNQQNLTADYFKVYRSNSGSSGPYTLIYTSPNRAIGYTDIGLANGTYYYQVEACNTVGCSPRSNTSQAVIINVTASQLSCGSVSVSPNPVVKGQPATFTYTISNTGSAAYTGTLCLWWRGSTTGNNLNQCINGLAAGASHTFTWTSSAIQSEPGTYYLSVEDASRNPTALCTSSAFTVVNSTSCGSCTWTNPPTGGSISCTAQAYLCQNGIIVTNQDGNYNRDFPVQRNQLARIIYQALYGTGNPATPADNFPTPFNDMQSATAQNAYWYYAAKALCYLEYGDGVSPFSRDFFNFRPADSIERRYAMKVFLEAFNIAPSTTGTNPFTDVPTNDPMYGYIKKAYDLGLVSGYSCTGGTCFDPYKSMRREEAFIILYRLMTFTNFTRPTSTQLQDTANYFIPMNLRLANMSNVPGIDQANFSHYQKTSFAIPGRGLPLEFTHSYNSYWTELPDFFFKSLFANLDNQGMNPLGYGWTHTYNIFAQKVDGYTETINGQVNSVPDRLYIFWADGSINVYNLNTNTYETQGVYDNLVQGTGTDGITGLPYKKVTITTKDQTKYLLRTFGNSSGTSKVYFLDIIQDRNSNTLEMSYEYGSPSGANAPIRLKTVTDNATGRSIGLLYNIGTNYIREVVDNSISRSIKFKVSAYGDLDWYQDAKGQYTEYYYDGTRADQTHLLTRIQLPKGNIITNTYYQRKLRSSETNTNKINVNWQNQYTTAMGQAGSTVKDNLNRTTTYQYNTSGNPTSIASPTTTVNNIQYGTGSNIFKPLSMNVQGQNVSMNYDANGNLMDITRNGITQRFTYTSKNDVKTYTDGNGNMTTYDYDPAGNLTSVTRPSGGGIIQIERNSFGQAKKITYPASISTYLDFDANGNVNSIQMPLAISTAASYDNASRLLSKTDANGNTTSFLYDNNDNLTKETNALGYPTDYTYDANDNLTHIKNAKNEITELTYRFDDDFLMSEAFGGNTKSYTYNTDGSLATFTKATGTFNYTYDATTGRLVSDGQTSYTYDSRNNIKTITNSNGTLNLYYDINDRLDYYDDYFGNRIDYSYDNNGNVLSITYPGNKTVNYTYDANNRMKDVTDWNSNKTRYDYLIDDRMDKVTYANGTYCQYSYDAAGRMIGMQNKKSNGTTISEYSYTLDKTGNHKDETINEPALATALSSLTNGTTNYGAMPFNRIQNAGSTNFTHDGAGNITQRGSDSYTFDLNDNLLSATGAYPATFTYDGSGNRRTKTANGTQTKYILNILGMSQVLMETDQSNTPTNYYIYGATGLVSRIKPNGTTHYYHYDFRGSTVAITDATQNITHTYAYDAFGTVLAANEPANDINVYRYNGQYGVQYDAPNRTFMRARYYDPQTGRFISEDPIWATNLYPFAENNPVNNVDPSGLLTGAQLVKASKIFKSLTSAQRSELKFKLQVRLKKTNNLDVKQLLYLLETIIKPTPKAPIVAIESSQPGYEEFMEQKETQSKVFRISIEAQEYAKKLIVQKATEDFLKTYNKQSNKNNIIHFDKNNKGSLQPTIDENLRQTRGLLLNPFPIIQYFFKKF